MTGMDDLLTWFRAQVDDDERGAREATQGEWRWTDPGGRFKQALVARPWPEQMIVPSASPDVYPSRYDADHIASWDPARVLALTAALRTILDDFSYEAGETRVVMTLAEALYADRPGYREEWRP